MFLYITWMFGIFKQFKYNINSPDYIYFVYKNMGYRS